MALVAGTRLGHYEVVAPLGAGGMGEVYRARDTRLDRTVAIKLLPPRVAHDPERRARFEREARTISSLNHPHICTLFDVGEEQGSHFLVMELLEGESLADRLQLADADAVGGEERCCLARRPARQASRKVAVLTFACRSTARSVPSAMSPG